MYMIIIIHVYMYVTKTSPYSNSNYFRSTVSDYCLTTVVFNWQVYQLLSKVLLYTVWKWTYMYYTYCMVTFYWHILYVTGSEI